MSNITVISGHPDLDNSYTNKVILDRLETELSNVEIRRLNELYPDGKINVKEEQSALIKADILVLQFPFYWYSVPALLKQWIDDVFAFNFAYGPEGDKLKGKDFILSFTIGGPEEAYQPLGYNHFRIEQLLYPLQQTAYLAGLNYQTPVYTHGMVYIPEVYNTQEAVEERARDHADRLLQQLNDLQNSAEQRFYRFVRDWFAKFDVLPEDSSFFLSHLAKDVDWLMPEGEFKGHAGFKDWYAIARQTFKPGCDHQVEQISFRDSDDGSFEAELRIRLIAETFDGENLNLLVNENWSLSMDKSGDFKIHEYRVKAV